MTVDYVAAGYWSGERVDDGLRVAAQHAPAATAVVDRGRRVTLGELNRLADRTAALLARLGVGSGDVVSFQLPNWLEAAVLYHATARVGAISNPIVQIYRHREVGFILKEARSRVLVIPDAFRGFDFRAMVGDLRPALPDLEHVLVVGRHATGMAAFEGAPAVPEDAAPPEVERRASDPVLLLYTSGTESRPKGVIHTHETLVYECASIAELYGMTGDDVVFMPSPVTHITGLLYGLQLPFGLGAPVVLLDAWSVPAALELIERERCTFTVGATPFLHGIVHAPDLAERDVSSMRVFVCGGADIPPTLVRDAAERTSMLATRVYGSTECPTATGTSPGEPLRLHAETDGAPIGPTQVRVVDDDDDAVKTPPATGNLQVRGPDLCAGYRDPALNAEAFTGDGWFRTGDLAEIDGGGRLRIVGRVKDIIVRGGENLSAKEIENLLFEHPDVREVAVVAFPDRVLGERVCAYVVGEADLTLESVVAFLRTRGAAAQKLPERLRLVDELPRTASGKVQKFILRAEQAREVEQATA